MKISTIGIGFLSAALLGGQALAAETDYAAGTTAMPLQQAAATARSAAMGGAVVAVPEGSASLLWNPAGLSRMNCTEIGFHHDSGLGSTFQEIAVVGTPLGGECGEGKGGKWGGLAASFGYANYGTFSGTDINGVPTGNYSAADYSGSVGWGMEFLPGLSGGLDLKTDHSSLAGQNYDVYAMDFGLLYTVLPSLDLGVTYTNLNLSNKVGGSPLAAGWRLGAAYTLDRHWLLAAAGELQDNAMNRINLGTEYLIGNTKKDSSVLALRAGYVVNYPNPQLTGFTGLTLGLGYTMTRNIVLDYAFQPAGSLGTSNRISLTFKFDCLQKPKPPVAAAPAPVAAAAVVADVPKPEPIVAAAPVEPPPIVVKSILLEDSHFDFDKSTLKAEGMAALRENIQLLKENPQAKVRVAGYTSASGTAEYNQRLSERRAAAVEAFLISEGGIAPGRITTIGYGETHPAEYEANPSHINSAAAKANMRVLFEVTVK